jgi:SAM-dependent methyltransferase
MNDDPALPPTAFDKQDTASDLLFYAPARLVTHIDAAAIAALAAFYRDWVPDGARVLDLMSSWISHLPGDRRYAEVVGHGMNADELAANTRLDRWFVQDLNADPVLALETDGFTAALCCVGVQYLQRPYDVFAEVRRVLAPGAPFVASYSNRCFPTKAVAVWRSLDMNGQASLIGHYLTRAGFGEITAHVLADGTRGDPLIAVTARA